MPHITNVVNSVMLWIAQHLEIRLIYATTIEMAISLNMGFAHHCTRCVISCAELVMDVTTLEALKDGLIAWMWAIVGQFAIDLIESVLCSTT